MFRWLCLLAVAGCPTEPEPTPTTGDTGACDPTETVVDSYCQSELCNLCTDDCTTWAEAVPAPLDPCTGSTTPDDLGCCVDSCTDPVLGALDKLHCTEAYGATTSWFDATTGALVATQSSTDTNEYCDGAAFGQRFGPDLTGCQ